MLFLKPPQAANDIRAFCQKFSENIRVEYKVDLDANVRKALPKIVSSFANSLGGVLIIGVRADKGVPLDPIEGFTPPPKEELGLTVENICLQNINPPVLPRCNVVQSDASGKVFLIVEIDESRDTPHAIENSTKVYVRTGDSSNPYELANVDTVISLLKRRDGTDRLRTNLTERARKRAGQAVHQLAEFVQVSLIPAFPRVPLSSADDAWNYCTQARFKGEHFFPPDTWRRAQDAFVSFTPGWEFWVVSTYGLVLMRRRIRQVSVSFRGNTNAQCFDFSDVLLGAIKAIVFGGRVYEATGYRGNLDIEFSIEGAQGMVMPFLDGTAFSSDDVYRCLDGQVSTIEFASAERLREMLPSLINRAFHAVCWSFWQSVKPFPSAKLSERIKASLAEYLNWE
jgi:hypothetical protein